jgi:two-component sensor histidine kinase
MPIAGQAVYTWTGTLDERGTVSSLMREPQPRFESIAAQGKTLPSDLRDLLGLLFQAVYPAEGGGRQFLASLWAEEGMHRAYAMLRLLDRRAGRHDGHAKDAFTAGVECALARSLASAYRSLENVKEEEIVQCAAVLRDVVLNLGALFGGSGVIVRTVIERLHLPAYKRRALVLSASELIINALTHGFTTASQDARIEVSLRRTDDKRACLRVADNGSGFGAGRPDTATSIAGGLAALVEADLMYCRGADWTTVAEIAFPIERATSARSARIIDMAYHSS